MSLFIMSLFIRSSNKLFLILYVTIYYVSIYLGSDIMNLEQILAIGQHEVIVVWLLDDIILFKLIILSGLANMRKQDTYQTNTLSIIRERKVFISL